MMFRFNRRYFLLSLLLLLAEIFIGVRMHDGLIRPYGGDFLVVVWLYCLVRSFLLLPVLPTAFGVLLFAYGVEASQYFGLADRLGFRGPSLMRVLLGSYFSWTDILCYTLGILTVIGVEGVISLEGRDRGVSNGEGEAAGELFVKKGSIVRKIWGSADTILFIFAGASAEFALNKAVDWLYFTGKLPADPLGRLFSTVAYAQRIVFEETDKAFSAIDSISAIHRGVEASRGASIPDEAYLDVLFLLIDYSIRSFELLQRRLSPEEKAEVFVVFHRVGARMGLRDLPGTYTDWAARRAAYLKENLIHSAFSQDLYKRYRQSLGWVRYRLLLQAQILLVPGRVRQLLGLSPVPLLWPVVQVYKGIRLFRLDKALKIILLPGKYKAQVFRLDMGN